MICLKWNASRILDFIKATLMVYLNDRIDR